MEIALTEPGKKTAKKITVSDDVFACEFNEPLVHQVVTTYMARGRAGTRAQKTRSEVRGGGAKPWRQKGTGRAHYAMFCARLVVRLAIQFSGSCDLGWPAKST